MRTSFGRVLVSASAFLAAAGMGATALVATPTPAHAAPCPTDRGVTVVVDLTAFGQGIRTACGSSGQSAAQLLNAVSTLTYVQRQPGFICRAAGVPANDPCVNTPPATAYWGLFHSDGRSGSWSYSTLGAGGLKVPDGGYVGLAWQGGSRTVPGVSPAPRPPAAKPTPAPTPKPAPKPAPKPQPPASQAPQSPAPPAGSPGGPEPRSSADPGAGAADGPGQDRTGQGRAGRTKDRGAQDADEIDGGDPGQDPSAAGVDEEPSEAESADYAPTSAESESAVEDEPAGGVPLGVVLGLLAVLAGAGLVGYRRRRVGA